MRDKLITVFNSECARAIELFKLGARLQLVVVLVDLSRHKLVKLYSETFKTNPPKGQLPWSEDWVKKWRPNMHSSLFIAFHSFLEKNTKLKDTDLFIKSYKLYKEHIEDNNLEEVLSFSRAWMVHRYIKLNMLLTTTCNRCGGSFVNYDIIEPKHFTCGICNPPSRAGAISKYRKNKLK